MKKHSAKQLVKEYAKNYLSDNQNIEGFFTEYSKSDYFLRLPYLPENEIFNFRLLRAFIKNERICIYADFDTDAVTSTGVMFDGLVDLGFKKENLKFYTPDRFKEGYGINLNAIKKLSEAFDLIITVDCGINSVIEADYLKDKKCDLIITDHHLLSGRRPDCVAVCNPQMKKYYSNQEYPTTLIKILKDQKNKISSLTSNYDIKLDNILNRFIDNQEKQKFNFLSLSTTGVGVAWFSLLNLAYFFDEIDL